LAHARRQTRGKENRFMPSESLANAIYHRYAAQTVCSMNKGSLPAKALWVTSGSLKGP
jgi:hypothetical protein